MSATPNPPSSGTELSQPGEPMPPGGWYGPPPVPVLAPLAGWWQRVGAAAIDGLVLLVPTLALSFLFFFIFLGPLTLTGSREDAVGLVAFFVATLAYVVVIFLTVLAINVLYAGLTMRRAGSHNGQTLGKQALGIRVVRMSGDQQTFWSAAVREVAIKLFLFGGLGGFLMGIPTLLDYLWPLWDDQRRALHDMLADTRVVSA